MNCSRQCWQTQFMSKVGFGNKMKLKSRLPPFFLICILREYAFCFCFHSCLHLSEFWCTRWQLDYVYRVDCVLVAPFLGSCPLLIDWKLSLISLARCMCFLARRVWRLILLPGMGLLGFSITILLPGMGLLGFSITIHRQGATEYKVHGLGVGGQYHLTDWKLR